jgi:DNA recombination protein RmuC
MQDGLLPVITLLAGGVVGFIVGRVVTKLQQPPVADGAPLEQAKLKLEALEKDIRDYAVKVATLDTEKAALGDRLKDQQGYVKQVQEEFQTKFENLAHKIFKEKNDESKKNLDEILKPLKEDLSGFKKHISESFGEHNKEQFALKKEIENIVRVSNEMKFQTENLSKALKGDNKTQGNWGEVILERILEASGLRKGEDYVPQAAGMGLKNSEDGRTQKPDFVIKLPEGKNAIIDSKVSLTSYERFCSEEDDTLRAGYLLQFLQSVKNHVKELSAKDYSSIVGLNTPDYVMMFMPIEGAYALAMQQDGELHSYAWDRKIIIVCPSTLFAILKIIASMWKLERQNKNADEIALRGGRLYDKIVGFVGDMVSLGKKLDAAQSEYSEAFGKLSKGTGNILRQAEQLKELGVKNSKTLPPNLVGDDAEVLSITKEDAA